MLSFLENQQQNSLPTNEMITTPKATKNNVPPNIYSKQTYSNFISNEVNYQTIDKLLENEKIKNKSETWNKLDKTVKIQKLHIFAEKYGKEHNLPMKEIKHLKIFFIDCLEKNKLQKTKELSYDKDTREIIGIPALYFNTSNRNFTLKIMDSKRVSTLKALTPKRISEKNKVEDFSGGTPEGRSIGESRKGDAAEGGSAFSPKDDTKITQENNV